MRYLKQFKVFNESMLDIDFDSMSDSDIEDRVKELRVMLDEFQTELNQVHAEKVRRKEEKQKVQELPKSIFDLNQEQFDIVFGDAMHCTDFAYSRMSGYDKQLTGVAQNGYRANTNQQSFSIRSSYYFRNANKTMFIDRAKSVSFLSKMLQGYSYTSNRGTQRVFDNVVLFEILYGENGRYNDLLIYDKNEDKFLFKKEYSDIKEDTLENLLNLIDKNDKEDED